MLGYALLNEIVNQRHLFDTVRVLEMLNLQIRVELRQKDELNADGMDIAL
ncbi:MAG TPA: serine/threonine protein kinase, partial [Microscillaceae bacterium]|nr:serine/threonine protein kinase [Microscillaceae bacterium]